MFGTQCFGGHNDQEFPPRFGAQNPSIDKIASLSSPENHAPKSNLRQTMI